MMNNTIRFNRFGLPALVLLVLALAAAPSFAQTTVDLCASDGTVTIAGEIIPIWGYADITGGGPCAPGLATLPGPEIRATAGETLTINLSNSLSEPVAFFVPGLRGASTGGVAGFFTQEADAGGSVSYTFTPDAGTYLYQSATHRIRTQVPMGLYGALVVDYGVGQAYADVPYDADQVLVFSEIDPALNADPAGFGGARVINWTPQYFLINGQSYDAANPPISITTSQDVLLRFVNAGLVTVVPTLDGGLYASLKAEDAHRYPQPIEQYGTELQAGKTIDAIVNAGSDGTYALYDRALHLANGGMISMFQAGAAAGAPTAAADSYSVDEDGSLTADGIAPNPAGVLDNDTAAAAAVLVSGPVHGSLAGGLAADGSFTYQPDSDFFGSDQFSYLANDGAGGPDSNVAIASITVNGINDAPVSAADAYEVVEGQILTVAAPGVLANDVDVDGDALSAAQVGAAPPGILTLNADGSFDYTPAGAAGAIESFDYEACDPSLACSAAATVTITVIAAPANVAPTAVDDVVSVAKNSTDAVIEVTGNDVDSDGTIDVASVVIVSGSTTQRGGTVVVNPALDGTVLYTPKRGFRGTDLFQYTVDDDDGATSNVATVSINVN